MRTVLFSDSHVGHDIAQYLLGTFPHDIAAVVVHADNEIAELAKAHGVPIQIFRDEESLIKQLPPDLDLGILAWWPRILKNELLGLTRLGFINTHPSLLPWNKGKHYNFWAIVEGAPFGVSLHMIDDGIDTGPIIAQREIPFDWTDTGQTLFNKAQAQMVELFRDTWPAIRLGNFSGRSQNPAHGSFHKAAELENASHIELDKPYLGRELLNLLRARTFPPHPACWFEDGGREFEIRVEIRPSFGRKKQVGPD